MVFEDVGYSDYSHMSAKDKRDALYRGSYVHRATHLIDLGDAGIWKKIYEEAPQYLGFIEGYCEFKEAYRFRPRMSEIPLYNPEHGFGVTPDAEGIILDGDEAIVEKKTGVMPWWTCIQTAAQDMGVHHWDKDQRKTRRRFGVELKANGKFRVKEFDDEGDYYTWQSNLHTAKRHHREPPPKLTAALGY